MAVICGGCGRLSSSFGIVIIIAIVLIVVFTVRYTRTHTVCWTATGKSLDAALPQCVWPGDTPHIHGGHLLVRDETGAPCADITIQDTAKNSSISADIISAASQTCSGSPCSWTYHGTGEFVCRSDNGCSKDGAEQFEVRTWDARSN